MNRIRLQFLQGFRGVAALLVVLYHTGALFAKNLNIIIFNNAFKFGHCGVEFFFVLSGFIIYYVHQKDLGVSNKLVPYLKKRLIRIYPIWLIILAITLLKKPIDTVDLLKAILLVPTAKPFVLVSWTLSYEIFFYLLFAAVIILYKNKFFKLLLALYLLSIFCFNYFAYSLLETLPFVYSFFFSKQILNFFLGTLGAWVITKGFLVTYRKYILVFGIFLFSASSVWSVYLVNFIASTSNVSAYSRAEHIYSIPENYSNFYFGVPCLLIVVGAVFMDLKDSFKLPELFLLIGNASFSIYLIHASLLNIITLKLSGLNLLHYNLAAVASAILAIGVGIFVYLCVEKPILQFLSKKFITTSPTV